VTVDGSYLEGDRLVLRFDDVNARLKAREIVQATDDAYLIALSNLDAVIQLIRNSKDPEQARQNLQTEFGMSEVQAQAIVDLRHGRLTGLEQDSIRAEHAELTAKIGE
jgi:DNA gyrase/topoisomerase IV subunit A